MDNLRNLWYRLTVPHAADKDDARREYMTKVILIILNVVGWGMAVGFFAGVIRGKMPPPALLNVVLVQFFLIGSWLLADRGYWRPISYALPAIFFLPALRTNYSSGVGTVAMLLYAMVILLTAMLQGGKMQWVALGLSVGTYLTMGWMHVQGRFPTPLAPEDDFVGFAIPVSGMLLFITVLQWFYTSQFQRTIAELAESQASLEQRVAERTDDLQKSMVEREQLQKQVIETQRQTLKDLSTPIIPIMEAPDGSGGIMVMPLVGSIDSTRARDITRALLAGIRQHRAKVVILDITGVPLVDSGVASNLNKTIQAARLKGARTIVTGISEAVAETIVDLGIDWDSIETVSNSQMGLRIALRGMGLQIVRSL
ncbi:MAG: STAS domain-containing protein [Chloroflexi bacterium]|nr:STAS domain-containing protein [Chloroflexota bacterium]